MRWLHGLLDDCDQVLTQLAQVHFVAQCGTECSERVSGIVFATIETVVNTLLNAMGKWLGFPLFCVNGAGACMHASPPCASIRTIDGFVKRQNRANDLNERRPPGYYITIPP